MIVPCYPQSRISRRTVTNIQSILARKNQQNSYANAYLESLQFFGIKLGLERILHMCNVLHDPQKHYPSIVIGGTNGKGSTAAFLSSILESAGLSVGLFTSPHLISCAERIQINRIPILLDRMASLILEHKRLMQEQGIELTYFEFMTSLAFQYFKEEAVTMGIFEVGLGGRFDATNVLEPCISCITHVHYDHTEYLGNSLRSIALEKAGIIKKNSLFINAEPRISIKKLFKHVCLELRTQCINVLDDTRYDYQFKQPYYFVQCTTPYRTYESMRIPLLGFHQIPNVLLALRIAEELANKGIAISADAIKKGIENTIWDCRLEVVRQQPLTLLDSAHNVEGIQAALGYCASLKKSNLIVVLGVLKDKQWKNMAQIVDYHADEILFAEPLSERALPADSFTKLPLKTPYRIVKDPFEAYQAALSCANPDSVVLVFGSMYLVGYIKKRLAETCSAPYNN
jgi:dihydrofolate synthase / folylpolyglutamate synthase